MGRCQHILLEQMTVAAGAYLAGALASGSEAVHILLAAEEFSAATSFVAREPDRAYLTLRCGLEPSLPDVSRCEYVAVLGSPRS